jgi:SAM-dependent methyltransferase
MQLETTQHAPLAKTPGLPTRAQPAAPAQTTANAASRRWARSPYLVRQLQQTPERNLFNHVKFHLIKDAIEAMPFERPRVLDLGCGLQVSRRYLASLGLRFEYLGVDYEDALTPDLVADLFDLPAVGARLPWRPDVVLLLDVLEHLHEDPEVLATVLAEVCRLMPPEGRLIVALPQMYRLDRFKPTHLHYPEHKIRLDRHEWRALLERHFQVQSERGLGYLSVLPYLTMASRRYRPDNLLGRLFRYLRGSAMELPPLKPLDLWLSRALGQLPLLRGVSNDLLFVAGKGGQR